MSGFTISYRDKWEHPVFRNLLEAGIWAWMCDTAAWKDTKVRFNGELVSLKRGQLVTSVRFIAKGFSTTEQLTRTFIKNLENDGMANTQTTHRGTIITICNYDRYQQTQDADNTHANEQPTHSQHTANTNKKEYNNINKDNIGAKIALKPDDVSQQVFDDFLALRKEKRAKLTVTALAGIRREAEKAGFTLEKALRRCCERGWQGFKAEWVADEKPPERPKDGFARAWS